MDTVEGGAGNERLQSTVRSVHEPELKEADRRTNYERCRRLRAGYPKRVCAGVNGRKLARLTTNDGIKSWNGLGWSNERGANEWTVSVLLVVDCG